MKSASFDGKGRILALAILLSGSTSAIMRSAPAQENRLEFQPDANTLYLAHFNDNIREADYAASWKEFSGSGATLAEGYYGKAANLRGLQFNPNYAKESNSYTPYLSYWGIWPRGNVNYRQGTLEFWFQTSPNGLKQNTVNRSIFYGHAAKHVMQNGRSRELWAALHPFGFDFFFPFLDETYWEDKINFTTIPGYKQRMDPDQWHHFAMTWSPGEMVIYFDGRAAASHDMTGKNGLVLAGSPHRDLAMNGIVMDEFRISDVVRYEADFEPRWRDGQRPKYAFTGNPAVKRFPAKRIQPLKPQPLTAPAATRVVATRLGGWELDFDSGSGYLAELKSSDAAAKQASGSNHGVLLWKGLERESLPQPRASAIKSNAGEVSFTQTFGDQLRLSHEVKPHDGGLRWQVTFNNLTAQELWLEALMSLPLPLGEVQEYFDGSSAHKDLKFSRRRDQYIATLPFAAASDGKSSMGVGIDPHTSLSVLISEWLTPEANRDAAIRQGSRMVLNPKGEYTLNFHVVKADADFGVDNAVDRFHATFPDLYRQRPDVPIYSYMPVATHFLSMPLYDLARLTYTGQTWGHGPGHIKGDEYGSRDLWNNPKYYDDPSYDYTRKIQALWGSIDRLRHLIPLFYRRDFDGTYAVRRFHYVPNVPMVFVARDRYPGYVPKGDPLIVPQYYYPNMWITNEYQNPLGKQFQQATLGYDEAMGAYSNGFINDMCHTSSMRHTDASTHGEQGRAFSHDRGAYLVGAFGHIDRYNKINDIVRNGFRQSIWSDGGIVSYMLCAHSAALAVEAGGRHLYLTGPGEMITKSRYWLGEKPNSAHHGMHDDYLGYHFKPEDFTPGELRDFYRYCDAHIMLFAIKNGIYLEPAYSMGSPWMMERVPVLVESVLPGRKLLPGGRVPEPLWLRRAGDGLDTFLVVGNQEPSPQSGDVTLLNKYFGDEQSAPILGAYLGGDLAHQIRGGETVLPKVEVATRDVQAFKTLALLHRQTSGQAATVRSSWNGDGATVNLTIDVDSAAPTQIEINRMAPMYDAAAVRVNGKAAAWAKKMNLPGGKSKVEVTLQNRALAFSGEDWKAVELIRDRKTNFFLAADEGFTHIVPQVADQPGLVTSKVPQIFELGFERGTAGMLNQFIEHYDEEDGVLGNLKPAAIGSEAPASYGGWVVRLSEDKNVAEGRVRINRAAREIVVEGPTQGEMRRAMVVLMRLVDRKYPHVGRHAPLKGRYTAKPGQPPWEAWRYRKQTADFFKNFEDKEWLEKPILKPEQENLYAGGNKDFTGKYTLQAPPYVYEPTYNSDFVYGFKGGAAEPVPALKLTDSKLAHATGATQ